jgi:hypothetical protein
LAISGSNPPAIAALQAANGRPPEVFQTPTTSQAARTD